MQEVRRELFSEPCVKLEKLDLVEDLNKGVKPVVVLKKLSIDEVQKLISNSRSSKSSKSKSSYGKSFGGKSLFSCFFVTGECLVYCT